MPTKIESDYEVADELPLSADWFAFDPGAMSRHVRRIVSHDKGIGLPVQGIGEVSDRGNWVIRVRFVNSPE